MVKLSDYAGLKICVAVSGGRDSMALLDMLEKCKQEYSLSVCALNCDHGMRECSSADSKFVKDYCKSRLIPLKCYRWEGADVKNETTARLWRINCYADALNADENGWAGADVIATAHHLDDNAETVLFNLARGAYLSGLQGITDTTVQAGDTAFRIIHPLIGLTRAEIDAYIRQNAIPYVDDETNFRDDYTRNKIRHNVLPELERAVPAAAKAIYRFSRLAADDEQYFKDLIKERRLIHKTVLGVKIDTCPEKPVFRRAALAAIGAGKSVKDYTSDHAERLYNLQFAENGKKFEFLGFTAFKEDGGIAVCANEQLCPCAESEQFLQYVDAGKTHFCGSRLAIVSEENKAACVAALKADFAANGIEADIKTLTFDIDAVPTDAVIRFAAHGDTFAKFGGGTKKLGDYFTDRKIPLRYRTRIPLIASGSEVLAVGGVEISDRIKVNKDTKKIFNIVCALY